MTEKEFEEQMEHTAYLNWRDREATPQWQPIATAPKDGRVILVAKTGSKVPLPAYWNAAESNFYRHWDGSRPLDAPPTTTGGRDMNWQPIETAPKDGTRFLAPSIDGRTVTIGLWSDQWGGYWDDGIPPTGCPSHHHRRQRHELATYRDCAEGWDAD